MRSHDSFPSIRPGPNVNDLHYIYSPNVKRIVITSSAASLIEPKDEPYTYTEKDWNNVSAGIVEKEGVNSPGIHIYRTSKGTRLSLQCQCSVVHGDSRRYCDCPRGAGRVWTWAGPLHSESNPPLRRQRQVHRPLLAHGAGLVGDLIVSTKTLG